MKKITSLVCFALVGSCLLLASCASVMDKQTVQMTIKTPGANNAKCFIENKGYKYVAYSNQTIEVMKTPYDFTVRCMASGNREKTVLVKREINDWVFVNVANGFVPGATYDVLSNAIYDYPDEVSVCFDCVPKKCYSSPELSCVPYYEEDHVHHRLEKKPILYPEPIVEEEVTPVVAPVVLDRPVFRPWITYDPTEEDK
jgi:hypothetical protein